MQTNELGQPVGDPLPEWPGARSPEPATLEGRYCRLEPLSAAAHVDGLFEAYASAPDDGDWTYLPVGPFRTRDAYLEWAEAAERSADPLHFAVVSLASGAPLGTLSLMRHTPAHGVIEVGFVVFSRLLARTRESTEAQYLLMRHAFDDLGYRRYEWKCDSLNAPSRATAERLGFAYEGLFRQAVVVKGRNRDTAWFSILDGEWPRVRNAFEAWLDPANFEPVGAPNAGAQRRSLAEIRAALP